MQFISKCSITDINAIRDERNLHPIFFLDEYPTSQTHDPTLLRLMRNLFRAARIPLILMGTDASAANLITLCEDSRGNEIDIPWCYVFHKLPKFFVDDEIKNSPLWLQELLVHSRPLFSRTFFSLIEDEVPNEPTTEFLNPLLDRLAVFASANKCLTTNDYGLHGQICLFLNASYTTAYPDRSKQDDRPESRTPLIHRHYACLASPEESPFALTLSTNTIKYQGSSWTPSSTFPLFQDDMLLYLSLMGTKNTTPFNLARLIPNRLTFREAIQEIANVVKNRQLAICFDNAKQASNSGMFYEAWLCGSMIVASHLNGIEGVTADQFFLNLMKEVSRETERLSPNINAKIALFLKSITVPYMSPPNAWNKDVPNCLKISFGDMQRTIDIERVDMKCLSTKDGSFIISGESKDYSDSISTETMQEIIIRVPSKTKLHIVLVRKLQQSYFTKTSYADWVKSLSQKNLTTPQHNERKDNLSSLVFCQMCVLKKEIYFYQITGLPFVTKNKVERLVIFFASNN